MRILQVVALGAALAGAALAGVAAAQQPAEPPTSTLQGVFTAEQVERGRAAYYQSCSQCHGAQLEGVEDSPDLAGRPWVNRWAGAPVGAIYDYARTQMPIGRPGSMGTQAYVDIVAFMLSRSGYPAGQTEMPVDENVLYGITIDPLP